MIDDLDSLKKIISKDQLIDLYVVQGIKLKSIAQIYDTTEDLVSHLKFLYQVSASPASRKSGRVEKALRLGLTKDGLEKEFSEGATDRSLAKKYGFNRSGMDYLLFDYFGIEKRSSSESKKLRYDHITETNLERYGTANSYNVKRDEINKKFQERYGGNSPWSSPEIREKSRKTLMDHYGVTHNHYSPEIVAKDLATKRKRYGKSFVTQSHHYEYNGLTVYSKPEYDFLLSLGNLLSINADTTEVETRGYLPNLKSVGDELDIVYLKKYAIEINDSATHHSSEGQLVAPKSKFYHQRKSLKCRDRDILLLHAFEDDFDYINYFLDIVTSSDLVETLTKWNIISQLGPNSVIVDLSKYNLPLPLDQFKFSSRLTPSDISTTPRYVIYNSGYDIYTKLQATNY